jgi:hypothetical protein
LTHRGSCAPYRVMGVHETIAVWADREPTLDEEIGLLGDEDVFEMANLSEDQTGVPGVVFISTAMGSHGPRVKFFLKPGRNQPSFSVAIAAEPRVVGNSLPERDLARFSPAVIEWVALNHVALTRFWWDGPDWVNTEVQTFIDALQKV